MNKTNKMIFSGMTLFAAIAILSACSSTAQAATVSSTAESAVSTEAVSADSNGPDKKAPEDKLLTLVNEGKLSQTTYDAVLKYLQENPPEKPDGMGEFGTPSDFDPSKMPENMEKPDFGNGQKPENGQRPEPPKNGENPGLGDGQRPEPPKDGQKPDFKATDSNFNPMGGPNGMGPGMFVTAETLDKMLSSNVITQDEYTVLKEVCPEK